MARWLPRGLSFLSESMADLLSPEIDFLASNISRPPAVFKFMRCSGTARDPSLMRWRKSEECFNDRFVLLADTQWSQDHPIS
jgi:hypothetical protein